MLAVDVEKVHVYRVLTDQRNAGFTVHTIPPGFPSHLLRHMRGQNRITGGGVCLNCTRAALRFWIWSG